MGTARTKRSAAMLKMQVTRIGVRMSAVMHRGFPSGGETFLAGKMLARD
jgi:hypothetical protein